MSNVRNKFELNINQIATMIRLNGEVTTYFVEGHMGSGKSAIVALLREQMPDTYNYVTVDCTQWDVGDVQIPDVDKEALVTRFLPNELLVGRDGKPMCICFDELGKAARPVQNAILPIVLERRVGIKALPKGSLVFATTNLGEEGVGDSMQAHARDRVCMLEMRKPNSEEWVAWGVDHDVHPTILAWANDNEQLFQDFRDVTAADNPYIFHNKETRKKFVTQRSLKMASDQLHLRDKLGTGEDINQITMASLAGVIGDRAASDLSAYVTLADTLPKYKDIVTNPEKAKMPDNNPAAIILTVFNCLTRVTKEELDAVMTYFQRSHMEIQALFAAQLMKSASKRNIGGMHKKVVEFALQNKWAFD